MASQRYLAGNCIMDEQQKMMLASIGLSVTPLKHMDTIKEGDIVFDDFNVPMFKVGANHARVGTEYDSNIDMPIYRVKEITPTKIKT